jgi:hypothetical protein
MPVTQSMLPQLLAAYAAENAKGNSAADAAAHDSRTAALQQYLQKGQQEHDLKVKQMEPELAGQKQQSINDVNLDTAEDPRLQSLANEGGSVKVGDLSFGANPYTRAMASQGARTSQQAKALAAEAAKTVKPLSDQASTLQLYNDMLDNPNSYDQKKLQVLGARLVEGPGQRLLDSVVQAMGASGNTLQGTAQDKMNYLMSTAKSGLSPQQINAMRETSFKYHDELAPQYEEARNKFTTYAPQLAPDIAAQGNLQPLIDAQFQTGNRTFDSLSKRREAFKSAAGKNTTLQNPNPIYQQPTSPIDKLKSFFGGGQSAAPAPAAPQQGGLSPEQEARRQELLRKAQGG